MAELDLILVIGFYMRCAPRNRASMGSCAGIGEDRNNSARYSSHDGARGYQWATGPHITPAHFNVAHNLGALLRYSSASSACKNRNHVGPLVRNKRREMVRHFKVADARCCRILMETAAGYTRDLVSGQPEKAAKFVRQKCR